MKRPIYLDYNATTPVDPRVLERMLPFFTEYFGNASSKGHAFGWAAAEAVKQAREHLACGIGADPAELFFTGGATEALNTAIKGVAAAYAKKGRHLVTVQTEHKGVLNACKALERQGYQITLLPVNGQGLLDVDELEASLSDETILVAVMWANNETGVLQPIPEIAARVRERRILFLTDATQALGKIPIDVRHADLLACTAHKLYGPKGVGALYVRRRNPRVRIAPLIDGGSQEEGLRAGTLNVPGIVGFGAAVEIARTELTDESRRLSALRDAFESALQDRIPEVKINGAQAPRLPHVSNLSFPGVTSAHLVASLRELAMSTGSACSTGTGNPSHVLKAMGLTDDESFATLRISIGRFSTQEEMEFAADRIGSNVERLLSGHSVTKFQ